ncbi:putative toxin-antitoxin system toxin component, PIN family [Pedobacter hiemivivus]|uniref:Putative toxin-antitoxin system toxin component, PIN family n=1 Tax=Pedobacter hiemivivus TaxID=2530454 RepID=A0A4R0MJH4_9SPHI|nr:putative toxin-antitoxin system toxin component, PIN family [Pedobacter hiemivivus]TCC86749.1 putative toxin-antitoxin system toxin component, PIN family [Pedobacter hiemivivus]
MVRTKSFVLDTNILISAFIIKSSISAKVLVYCIYNGILLFSEETFFEFERVLLRPKFDKYVSKLERTQILYRFSQEAQFKKVKSDFKICRDNNDNMFLNLATDHNTHCIVTGDQDLLALNPFENIPILTPIEFLSYFNDFDDSLVINEPKVAYTSPREKELIEHPKRAIAEIPEIMRSITKLQEEAARNGLTQEILERLLREAD